MSSLLYSIGGDLQRMRSTMSTEVKLHLMKLWSDLLKRALDKYNIYLFVSCSKENYKINQYQKIQPIRPMRFHFI